MDGRTWKSILRARGPPARTDEPLGKAAAEDEFARWVGALLALKRVALCVATLPYAHMRFLARGMCLISCCKINWSKVVESRRGFAMSSDKNGFNDSIHRDAHVPLERAGACHPP